MHVNEKSKEILLQQNSIKPDNQVYKDFKNKREQHAFMLIFDVQKRPKHPFMWDPFATH